MAVGVAAALVLGACGGDDGGGGEGAEAVTVGSANFPESQLLAEIYAQALEAADVSVERNLNTGSREAYFGAIEAGEIDLLPEYTNSLLSFVLRIADPEATPSATSVDEQVTALGEALPESLKVLTPSTAEDKDVIVCRADIAEGLGITNLSELAAVADQITLGAPPEFEQRSPFGLAGFRDLLDAEFAEFVPLAPGEVADALKGEAIDCGNLFSTMSVITTEGFVALEDDQTLVPNEAVLPLIRVDAASDEVVEALDAVSASLTTDKLKAMMVEVEVEAADPADVAADYLAAEGLG
ncbi:MAG: ABC transporter substrate-binding protein [Actinomycetota bacterium]|nr:MAG: ABC transporter substrate-binding protein [Actinomycetota bacterium]